VRQFEEAKAHAQRSELTVGKLEYERDALMKVQLDSPVNKPVVAESPVDSSETRS